MTKGVNIPSLASKLTCSHASRQNVLSSGRELLTRSYSGSRNPSMTVSSVQGTTVDRTNCIIP